MDEALTIALKNWESCIVKPRASVHLSHIPADATDYCDEKKTARAETKHYRKQIDEPAHALAVEDTDFPAACRDR